MKKKELGIIKDLEKIEKKEESALRRTIKGPKFKLAILFLVLAAISAAIIYLVVTNGRVYVDKAEISAPVISLSASAQGILDRVLVKEGDIVSENMIVAEVGGNPIRAKTNGIVISVQNTPGQLVNAQSAIVKMIDPSELRVVGRVQETNSLNEIKAGQKVIFTADAFGSKQYEGFVDLISESARSQDIVFSISDKRPTQEFDVSARFDINAYPELKNGMSARMWIYK